MYICLAAEKVEFSEARVDQFDDGRFVVSIAVSPAMSSDKLRDWSTRQARLPGGYPKPPAFVYGADFTAYGDAGFQPVFGI